MGDKELIMWCKNANGEGNGNCRDLRDSNSGESSRLETDTNTDTVQYVQSRKFIIYDLYLENL